MFIRWECMCERNGTESVCPRCKYPCKFGTSRSCPRDGDSLDGNEPVLYICLFFFRLLRNRFFLFFFVCGLLLLAFGLRAMARVFCLRSPSSARQRGRKGRGGARDRGGFIRRKLEASRQHIALSILSVSLSLSYQAAIYNTQVAPEDLSLLKGCLAVYTLHAGRVRTADGVEKGLCVLYKLLATRPCVMRL